MEILKTEVKRVVANPNTKVVCVRYKVNQAFVNSLQDKEVISHHSDKLGEKYEDTYYKDGSILQLTKYGYMYFEFEDPKNEKTGRLF
ncbi:hypothetical protein G1K97_13495 [Tenacibaculum finnmarkense]|uniref:hypothetical protein n=1 Tax=Tenacibaculum finnmarkense TaxID=2781243 RepID=UPI001EFB10FB|nr:hypothetical protein [Tenacibaculum finnmarkense]MCG8894767.1 hypothetical protein [Tenacibaculum finnmarkense]MCG8902843.1 hypothetical protein [Tenacibaculum finnmarkense]